MPRNNRNNNDDDDEGFSYYLKQFGWFALQTAALAGTVISGANAAVSAVGFKEKGVEKRSMAAKYQSANARQGNDIEEGSHFSNMQRAGTKGIPNSAKASIVVGSAVVTGLSMLK